MAGLLQRLERIIAPKPLEPSEITIAGQNLAVVFRRNARAKRLVLRLSMHGTEVQVTVPKGVSRARALEFTERSRSWIASKVALHGGNVHLKPGERILLRGIEHEIRHAGTKRGLITIDVEQRVIHVPGELAHIPRRLRDWLKAQAHADLAAASARYATLMGVTYRRITVRDQRTRWGSCSSGGDLSYSWRLILVPPHVLDYVAAHEVAHLKHLDHSPRFWRLVLSHCAHASKAKTWLKTHGQTVHRVVA
jgi:predicted metal-dependent hydrolase